MYLSRLLIIREIVGRGVFTERAEKGRARTPCAPVIDGGFGKTALPIRPRRGGSRAAPTTFGI